MPSTPDYVARAKEYIREHLTEDLYLLDVARAAGCSPAYLSTVFKRTAGISMMRHIQAERVARAKAMIEAGAQWEDVSSLVGYRCGSSFAKTFKDTVGMTPREYARATDLRSDATTAE